MRNCPDRCFPHPPLPRTLSLVRDLSSGSSKLRRLACPYCLHHPLITPPVLVSFFFDASAMNLFTPSEEAAFLASLPSNPPPHGCEDGRWRGPQLPPNFLIPFSAPIFTLSIFPIRGVSDRLFLRATIRGHLTTPGNLHLSFSRSSAIPTT